MQKMKFYNIFTPLNTVRLFHQPLDLFFHRKYLSSNELPHIEQLVTIPEYDLSAEARNRMSRSSFAMYRTISETMAAVNPQRKSFMFQAKH